MEMKMIIWGLLIPFVGTVAGAAGVFFLKRDLKIGVQRALTGFAAGVMVAASIWSLILPAIEQSSDKGHLAFFPAFVGFWLGTLFLLLLDHVILHLHRSAGQTDQTGHQVTDREMVSLHRSVDQIDQTEHQVTDREMVSLHRSVGQTDQTEGLKSMMNRTGMMIFTVTLHNIPEGMAVGVVCAGLRSGSANITASGVLALALGIAIQNFPEGAIVSMPLFAEGKSRSKSFWLGVLSGAVEPVFGGMTVLVANLVIPVMPCLLSFAAGAMLYVVVEELIPEMSAGGHSNIGILFFSVGFSLMMVLDVALGSEI